MVVVGVPVVRLGPDRVPLLLVFMSLFTFTDMNETPTSLFLTCSRLVSGLGSFLNLVPYGVYFGGQV